MTKVFKKVNCPSCGGSGIFQGMAERETGAVPCNKCDGKGWIDIKINYTPFKKKVIRKGVKRIYPANTGYFVSGEDVVTEDGVALNYSKYGISYKEWLKGKIPVPMKELYCPNTYLRSKGGENGINPTKDCEEGLSKCNSISKCECWSDKKRCWEMYEKKFKPDYLNNNVIK